MNRGIVGTQQINIAFAKIIKSYQLIDTSNVPWHCIVITIGDRVMQIRNNYDKSVFNGDIGTIDDINISDKIYLCDFMIAL